MSGSTDKDLMNRLAQGDQGAMQTIFQSHFTHIYQTTFKFIKQKEVSEDLSQEVFMKLWRKRSTITIKQTLKGYLTTMAYHEAMGYLRKQTPKTTDLESIGHLSEEDGWENVKKTELEGKIHQAINGLAPRCKSVFILSRYEGKTYREIAAIMEISVKTVENQMGKALQILRKELQEYIQFALPIMWVIHFFFS